MFARSGISTWRVLANLPNVGPNWPLNATGTHSDTFNSGLGKTPNRAGQPYPVFKSKWGLECVQG